MSNSARAALETICGFHAVEAVLTRAPQRVLRLLLSQQRNDARLLRLEGKALAIRVAVQRLPGAELDRIAGDLGHQGVLAELLPMPEPDESDLYVLIEQMLGVASDGTVIPGLATSTEPPLLLVLDEITDPRNFGALLRVADGAGVHAVVTTRRNSPPLSAVVHKSAAGAASVVPLFRVTNLARALERLRVLGVASYGLDDAGATLWHDAELCGPAALVLGAEGTGLRRLTRERCDQLLRLPMAGVAASLNVSVAAGVALYEVRRQRGAAPTR